jgi:hypothetical protein
MPIKRLLKIVLIAIAVASGFSSCCSISQRLGAYGIGPDAPMDVDPPINGDLIVISLETPAVLRLVQKTWVFPLGLYSPHPHLPVRPG